MPKYEERPNMKYSSYLYFSVSQLHRSDPCEGLALRYEKAPGT